jgi:arylformamidase
MYIDLSLLVSNETPVFPGDPTVHITQAGTFEKEGYCGHQITMGNHVGTHIDAPAHMLQGGRQLSSYNVSDFIGTLRYIHAVEGFSLQAVQQSGIQPGDVVIFNTGFSEKFNQPAYYTDYPVLPIEVANYLAESGVKMIGLDTCSADNTPDFVVHKTLLSKDILIIENLTNVQALQHVQGTVYALPMHMQLDAAPARVIVQVKEQ